MDQFEFATWSLLLKLLEADDGPGLKAWAAAQPDRPAAALRWHAPDDEQARSLLMLAYWGGYKCAAKALVNAGSDWQQEDANGRNASWYSRRPGQGAREIELSNFIGSTVRRLSMRDVIDRVAGAERDDGSRKDESDQGSGESGGGSSGRRRSGI